MSIRVAIAELGAEVHKRGPGYLLTSTEAGRPHVMQLRFTVEGGGEATMLRTGVGRSAARNIAAQPAVTLLWPPFDDPDRPDLTGYSLIVDAQASIDGTDGASVALLEPTGAVLHRPA
jgi:hypothetical protein